MHRLIGRTGKEEGVGGVERLQQSVEREYGIEIKGWKVIKKKRKSSHVVRVDAADGKTFALKSLYLKPERQRFIAQSEKLLAQRGVKLARPVPTLQEELFMMYGSIPYVMYEWIAGEGVQLRGPNDLKAVVKAMALFHKASGHLDYGPEVKLYSHPDWEKEYKQRISSMQRWLKAHHASSSKKHRAIVRHLPFFIRYGKKALKALKKSPYQAYRNRAPREQTLVHGDLHHKNVIAHPKGFTLFDFEDVRFDLPSKDLLRTYSMYTKNHPFVGSTFRSMLKTYERYHPLSFEVKRIVSIDMLFPHIFERMLRKKKYADMDGRELKSAIDSERKKANYVYRRLVASNGTGNGRG